MAARPAEAISPDALTHRGIPAHSRLRSLLTVLRWELRRVLASRATWIMAALLFGICLLLLGFSLESTYFSASAMFSAAQSPTGLPVQHMVMGQLSRNTLWGLITIYPITLVEFGVFLPFVTADGVSLDLNRRTHELLMTTPVPSWAYVWGRYLARMLIALGMAGVYLLAILTMAVELHLVHPTDSPQATGPFVNPALDLPGALTIWAVIALPPTVLLGSLGFALGILLPRRSNLLKSGLVFVWFAGGLFLPAYLFGQVRDLSAFHQGNPPAWWTAYQNWSPINTDAGHLFLEQFLKRLNAIVANAALSDQAVQQQAQALTQQMPDLTSFVWPHLVGVAVCLVIVVGASLTFRRFRNVVA